MKKTTPSQQALKNTVLAPEEVAAYLKAHSTFFEQHVDLLEHLKIPHGQAGVASLLEYQAQLLKEKHHKLQNNVKELLLVAEANEKLLRSAMQFSVQLFRATSLCHLIEGAEQAACHLFAVEVASIRFFENESLVWPSEVGAVLPQKEAEFLFGPFFSRGVPWCGPLYPPQLNYLFDEKAEQIASSGIVILKTAVTPLGIFALGSSDKLRFQEGAGTLFLEFIGNILSHRTALFYAPL